MSFFQFVSVRLCLFLMLGILLGEYLDVSIPMSGTFLLILFLLLLICHRQQKNAHLFAGIASLTACALGVFTMTLTNPKNAANHYSEYLKANDLSYTMDITISEVLKPTHYSQRFLAKIQRLDTTAVSGKILLSLPKDSSSVPLGIDDTVLAHGILKEIQGPLNPHQFDYKRFMEHKGVYHQIRLDPKSYLTSKSTSWSFLGIASGFRDLTLKKLRSQPFGRSEFAVMEAILLGQRNDLTETIYDDYKNAGAVHLLALSGLHIGILLILIQFLLSPLRRLPYGKHIRLFITLILLWAFAFLAGLSASIVRAVTMFSFVAYAIYLNRPTNTLNVITLSLFLLLLVRPSYLFEAGFQMSYAAVFAIVWLYPKLEQLWRPSNIVFRKAWQLLAVSCTAQLGVLPISLFYFHQFPGLFFISNLIIVPFLGLILGLGFLVLILSNLSILPTSLAHFYNGIITTMNQTVAWIGQQDTFLFKEIPFDDFSLVLSYALIFSLVFFGIKRNAKSLLSVLVAIVMLQFHALFHLTAVRAKTQFVLVHQIANTLLLKQQGQSLTVYSKNRKGQEYVVPNFKIAERISVVSHAQLQNSYRIGDKTLYVMDSLGVYPTKNVDYLLMTQSPKANLDRVLDSVTVGMVLVDGSNYNTAVSRWKTTCWKKEVPFHYTGEKGAFCLDSSKDYCTLPISFLIKGDATSTARPAPIE